MQTPEEMLDIFLEETGSDRDEIMSYGRVKSITYPTIGKPIYLRRYALWIVSNNRYNQTLYQSDRYELVTDVEVRDLEVLYDKALDAMRNYAKSKEGEDNGIHET